MGTMFVGNILLTVFLMISSTSQELYNEEFRPQLHYSPPKGWINDPNGLVYHNGTYHLLFCQHNPFEPTVGPIHWGHAISTDLVHWKTLDVALSPSQGNSIFSGGAIIDYDNVTGLQTDENIKTMITIFTAHDLASAEEKQWMAYSNDAPIYEKFQFYENNPVIPNPDTSKIVDFRDPYVFEYNDHFVIFLAAHDRAMIYNSKNLLDWQLTSEFGEFEGSHVEVWECPALFSINVTIDGEQIKKDILIISQNGPNMQYFIGSFDGKTFINENSKETELWIDYGPDSYAGITYNPYNQLPDGRQIFISWMNRWEYARSFDFNVWNGQMGIARELVKTSNDRILISSLPIREIETLRGKHYRVQNMKIDDKFTFRHNTGDVMNKKHPLDIELNLDLVEFQSDDTIAIVFSDKNDKLNISLKGDEFTLDRSEAGRIDFPNFGLVWKAPRLINSTDLKLRVIIDRSSIEFFADDGLTVMAALFYSEEDIGSEIGSHVYSQGGQSKVTLKDLNVYQMKSIWT